MPVSCPPTFWFSPATVTGFFPFAYTTNGNIQTSTNIFYYFPFPFLVTQEVVHSIPCYSFWVYYYFFAKLSLEIFHIRIEKLLNILKELKIAFSNYFSFFLFFIFYSFPQIDVSFSFIHLFGAHQSPALFWGPCKMLGQQKWISPDPLPQGSEAGRSQVTASKLWVGGRGSLQHILVCFICSVKSDFLQPHGL